MGRRSKWEVKKTEIYAKEIRDSEFTEVLAELGKILYDVLSSPPDSKSKTRFIATNSVENADGSTNKEGCR